MAKDEPRDIGLKSDSFVSNYPDGIMPRVLANVEAGPKVGKTDFCLRHVPGHIIVYNFDQGLEGVIHQHRARGKKIIIAGVPAANKSLFPSYHFARPIPSKDEKSRKDKGYLERVKAAAHPIWERFINDYKEGLESEARTLVIDTGGGAFQLAKFSFHGMDKVTTKDDPYGQKSGDMKSIFQGLVTDGYNYDKNILWIHRIKELWKGGEPSGEFGVDGYKELPYEVQVTLRLKKKVDKRGTVVRSVEIRDSRLDTKLEGEVFEGNQYRFSLVASLLTGTDEDTWE